MNNESHNRLMDEVKATRPTPSPSADDWVRSERGRSVLGRVLASVETRAPAANTQTGMSGGTRVRARWGRGLRIATAAGALVLVILAVSLSLVFAGREADGPTIAQDSSTVPAGPGTVEPKGAVTQLSAVEHVMRLVNERESWFGESVGSSTTIDQASLLDQAVDRGLIARSQISSGSAAEPLTQGQYAVLLWKAFGADWPGTTASTSPVVGTVDPEEKAAIQGLQLAAVIREADGVFFADRPLDIKQERLLLDRMEDALRGRASN